MTTINVMNEARWSEWYQEICGSIVEEMRRWHDGQFFKAKGRYYDLSTLKDNDRGEYDYFRESDLDYYVSPEAHFSYRKVQKSKVGLEEWLMENTRLRSLHFNDCDGEFHGVRLIAYGAFHKITDESYDRFDPSVGEGIFIDTGVFEVQAISCGRCAYVDLPLDLAKVIDGVYWKKFRGLFDGDCCRYR